MAPTKSNDQRLVQCRKVLFHPLAILLFVQTALIAQSPADIDHLVLNSGDTLYGTVQYIDERGVSPKFRKKIKLEQADGKKKKFKRKDVLSFQSNRQVYESFWLKQSSDRFSLDNPRYDITSSGGEQYFLKRISQGSLSHYQIEWWEQGSSTIMSMDLLIKENDQFLIRATQGVFGLKKQLVMTYLTDCTALRDHMEDRQLKTVWEVVAFYNENCEKQ